MTLSRDSAHPFETMIVGAGPVPVVALAVGVRVGLDVLPEVADAVMPGLWFGRDVAEGVAVSEGCVVPAIVGLGVRVAEESGDAMVGGWVNVAGLLLAVEAVGVTFAVCADVGFALSSLVSDGVNSGVGVGVFVGRVRKLATTGRVPSRTSTSGPRVGLGVPGAQPLPISTSARMPIVQDSLIIEGELRRA